MKLHLVFGNQLFPPETMTEHRNATFFMAEDRELCTYYRFHKHKIILFLAAMREYADELRASGFKVDYRTIDGPSAKLSFEEKLEQAIKQTKASELIIWEIEDKFMENRISELAKRKGLTLTTRPSPMFLTSRIDFATYLAKTKKPFMKTFYEGQRKRLKILVNSSGEPEGGQWSFDEDNREKLPKSVQPPRIDFTRPTAHVDDIRRLVAREFNEHPGSSDNFWLPVRRKDARAWLDQFLTERLRDFGPYEDALSRDHDFLFHSVLSPVLNLGLLLPSEVVERALAHSKRAKIPMNSVEGFIRQIIGWREFVRGIYRHFSDKQEKMNFWGHRRKLTKHWYEGTTGIIPLDDAIKKATAWGYTHHIERLMILSNCMLLSEIEPIEAHRWFMEMFVDSSDWVMGPNVFGMGLFSDGGIFATKPYICGSNYILKMSDYKKGPWCEIMDALYWSFIDKNREFYSRNPRMAMMAKTLDKMDSEKKARLRKIADEFRDRVTG